MGLEDDNTAVADPCAIGDFEVEGLVEGSFVRATRREGRLCADAPFLERAALLVAMGEVFSDPDSGVEVPAGLGEATQAALTLMRAADRITHFHLQFDDGASLTFQAGASGRSRLTIDDLTKHEARKGREEVAARNDQFQECPGQASDQVNHTRGGNLV